ncbi:MAG: hypothetical protein ABIW58_04685 [Sphingomicrobium sp.]
MLLLLAATVAATTPPPARAYAVARAQVSIRILTSASLRVGAERSEEGLPVRSAMIHDVDGTRVPARLVEFE